MNKNMPRTPFSTGLSGSAKEIELRIRNIMSGPKKRPPLPFLALVFFICIFCGNIVSCRVVEETPPAGPDSSAVSSSRSAPDSPAARAVPVDPENPPQGEEAEWLLQALFQAADQEETFQHPTARLLASVNGDGCVLGAAFVEDHLENSLILGVMDTETHALTGPIYRYAMKNAVPSVATFQDYDGNDCLLYTFNGQLMGQYGGEAGVVRFNGRDFTWQWPVEGDARYPEDGLQAVRGAQESYQDYWNSHLAVMAPGGVDIYTVNPEFAWGKDEPWSMWQIDSDALFYSDPSASDELPMPIYFQSLRWLVEHTNDPGGWQIVSLTLDEAHSDPANTLDCYTLQARETMGDGELFADLFFSYETEPSRPRVYMELDHSVVYESYTAYSTSPIDRDGSPSPEKGT